MVLQILNLHERCKDVEVMLQKRQRVTQLNKLKPLSRALSVLVVRRVNPVVARNQKVNTGGISPVTSV